jgi:hypothetical protein
VTFFRVLGVLSGLFALALIILPTIRILQGRLEARKSIGLWISVVGFAWLCVAAFAGGEAGAQAASVGIVSTVVGSIVQSATTKSQARPDE